MDCFNQKLLPINGSDVESFEMLNQFYARDNNHVYYQDQQIHEADPKTFKALNRSSLYAKGHL